MFKYILSIFLFLAVSGSVFATHNRAGEITYEHVEGLQYRFTIFTCTKTSSPADRPVLEIQWGDGSPADSVERINQVLLPNDIKQNIYVIDHIFAGPGNFTISVEDPNRNAGILNITNSVNVVFCITSTLVITPFGGPNGTSNVNNSVQLTNPPKENACINRIWVHNPGAFDPDGDSLVYSLINCNGENCEPIGLYEMPNEVNIGGINGGSMTIDPLTGTVIWDRPAILGEYNLCIQIEEFRNGIKVGSVVRDMQITVENCLNNPPVIDDVPDTCIEAGTTLNYNVTATDPDNHFMVLNGLGGPFVVDNPATLTNTGSFAGSITSAFTWNTNCEHVRAAPYTAFYYVTDQGSNVDVPLSDVTSNNILVVAPAPTGLTANPVGNSIEIGWDPSVCSNAVGYKIYRRLGFINFQPGACETGVPASTGYVQVGSTNGLTNTSFVDDQNLIHGEEFCYMVVACFADGAQSYASQEICAGLNLDLPVITHADVETTDQSTGEIRVEWVNPTELDAAQWPGPYSYQLYRSQIGTTPNNLIYTSSQGTDLTTFADTFFLDQGLNTEDEQYNYRIELYSGTDLVGSTFAASSTYLTLTPNDNIMTLDWSATVPWQNDTFRVFRADPGSPNTFNFVGETTEYTFTDTGLVNRQTYCYFVRGVGSFSDPDIPQTLINNSQIACASPTDLTPPCPPVLTVEGDCNTEENTITWTNPNNSCADDVLTYNLYYSETDSGGFTLLSTFSSPDDTSFTHSNFGSIAGCYYVTALDSLNPDLGQSNESIPSNTVCIDNCPEYVLPNVFSPNGDNLNDQFVPFPYKFVESIDLKIVNRWGNEVFATADPDINWDGRNQETGELVSDGVYYYVCIVNTIRLSGIEPITLTGFVQVFSDNSNTPN